MQEQLSLEKILEGYRVYHTPINLTWKQHLVNEKFSNVDFLLCGEDERNNFSKRLQESFVTICPNIRSSQGQLCDLNNLIHIITNPSNSNINKMDRNVVYSSNNGNRPVGQNAVNAWSGFQIIDMDIKSEEMAMALKPELFERLSKYNWFFGVSLSSSKKGLHIYTKIQISESDEGDVKKKKTLYLANFRHKYSFVYLACLNLQDKLKFTEDELLQWLDLAMFKPQQGGFIGYDEHPLINTNFFEDFIYVSFDDTSNLGKNQYDWVTYPSLREVFKRWEYFEEEDNGPKIEVRSAEELTVDTKNKVHYKHQERWRLANTLVSIYGKELGYRYLRMICTNDIRDQELQSDCNTAAKHNKSVDTWAVNRLNNNHGFKIKLNVETDPEKDQAEIYKIINNISNPTLIKNAKHYTEFHLTSKEYLGNIKPSLLESFARLTLLEAGPGLGKTEFAKSLARDGKRVLMVMPFTSTIKAKVETDKNWYYSYGNRKVRFDKEACIAMTVDKFSQLNLMDIKEAGFDYIIIDESHLMFISEYRPVMAKVIEMIRLSEVPIVLMSGTPVGETVFFDDIVHVKVIKDDDRKKEFHMRVVDEPQDVLFHMCRQMACDVAMGRRVLFPTNAGVVYEAQVKAVVKYFLERDHFNFDDINVRYYKKSNVGEEFMDEININKTIQDTQILLCSSYLSVGVDINDKYPFSIYFNDLMMPQEIEQFANRLRSNDLFIYLYTNKVDGEGNSKNIFKPRSMDLRLNENEIKDCHSILQLCNSMIERNPVEYKYNSLIASIINENKFVEYDEVNNRYMLNEVAYKTIFFERKYREFVQQLPIIASGMKYYGYHYDMEDLGAFRMEDPGELSEIRSSIDFAKSSVKEINNNHVDELLDIITEDRLGIYQESMRGVYEIRKGKQWKEDLVKKEMVVKNVEVFEKVVPMFISMAKMYEVEDVKSIFDFCKDKKGNYNFSALKRIRLLINIIYNSKRNRLDIPIADFMKSSYELADRVKVPKGEVERFVNEWAEKYAREAGTESIIILSSPLTMKTIQETFMKIFKCLINVSRPLASKRVRLTKVELIWQEKENYNSTNQNEKLFFLADFLDSKQIENQNIKYEQDFSS